MHRFLLFLLAVLLAPYAHAELSPLQSTAWQLAQAERRISLNQAADLVQQRTGGRVLSAQAVREQGREIYRIKVLTRQGEVRIVLVDAATGHME